MTQPKSFIEKANSSFEKLLKSFNKDMLEADLMFDEEGWTDKIQAFWNKKIREARGELFKKIEKEIKSSVEPVVNIIIPEGKMFISGFRLAKKQILAKLNSILEEGRRLW